MRLTPQFFANKPLDLLLHDGVEAERFNRFKLGRTLDEVHAYGCDLLFSELALAVCTREGIDQRFNHLDTTSFSLSGDWLCVETWPREVCLDPRLLYNFTIPRFGVELP